MKLLRNYYDMGIGDWGLGIAQSQSPIPNPHYFKICK